MVDDGSTDDSREIILKYKDKIKYVFKNNSGPADSLNTGFNLAKGEIFYYINSDDYILTNTLKIANELFKKYNQADLIYGNGYIIDENSYFKKRMFSTKFTMSRFKFRRANICQQATFIKREAFKEVNGFNILNDKSWDYELFVDIFVKKKNIVQVNDFLGAYRVYPGTITSDGYKNIQFQDDRLYSKYLNRNRNSIDRVIIKIIYFFDRIFNIKFWYCKITDIFKSLQKKKII